MPGTFIECRGDTREEGEETLADERVAWMVVGAAHSVHASKTGGGLKLRMTIGATAKLNRLVGVSAAVSCAMAFHLGSRRRSISILLGCSCVRRHPCNIGSGDGCKRCC